MTIICHIGKFILKSHRECSLAVWRQLRDALVDPVTVLEECVAMEVGVVQVDLIALRHHMPPHPAAPCADVRMQLPTLSVEGAFKPAFTGNKPLLAPHMVVREIFDSN